MTDEQYKEMNKAERRANKILKQNNYRMQKIKCCATCIKSNKASVDDPRICNEAEQQGWIFGNVDDLGICDKYEVSE